MDATGKNVLSLYLILPWIGLAFLIVGVGLLLAFSLMQRQSKKLLRGLREDPSDKF